MCIRLDRSYSEDCLVIDSDFSTPYFIKHMILAGYIKPDMDLEVSHEPHIVTMENAELLLNIAAGFNKYKLPIVYVSRTVENNLPVDVSNLAHKLKGVSHILVEDNTNLNETIVALLGNQIETNGEIGIYFPGKAMGHRKYKIQENLTDGNIAQIITHQIIQYSNAQKIDALYTWQGVYNQMLIDTISRYQDKIINQQKLASQIQKDYSSIEKNQSEYEEYIKELEKLVDEQAEHITFLENTIKENAENNTNILQEKLMCEFVYNQKTIKEQGAIPVLYAGVENEFYEGEVASIILYALKEIVRQRSGIDKPNRTDDILNDIINHNVDLGERERRISEIKKVLKTYTKMDSSTRSKLESLGFNFTADKNHYKMTYGDVSRYKVTIAKTPSDSQHAGRNDTSVIINKFF